MRAVVVPSAADEPRERRTVVISGHPGGLPMARPARPPKTAIERVGTRPDRIVAYAVALGFLLVLIAIYLQANESAARSLARHPAATYPYLS